MLVLIIVLSLAAAPGLRLWVEPARCGQSSAAADAAEEAPAPDQSGPRGVGARRGGRGLQGQRWLPLESRDEAGVQPGVVPCHQLVDARGTGAEASTSAPSRGDAWISAAFASRSPGQSHGRGGNWNLGIFFFPGGANWEAALGRRQRKEVRKFIGQHQRHFFYPICFYSIIS